jgi:hypothetical protein
MPTKCKLGEHKGNVNALHMQQTIFNQATLLMLCTISLPVRVSVVHRPREVGSVSGLNG